MLTVGQYLRPTEKHLPVVRYWHPDEFAALEKAAYALGFESVAAGPLVRSSYHATSSCPAAATRVEPRRTFPCGGVFRAFVASIHAFPPTQKPACAARRAALAVVWPPAR